MKSKSLLLGLIITAVFSFIGQGRCEEDDIYYARCNLKVIKGDYITWMNWQFAPTFIPAGAELKVTRHGSKATVVDVKTGNTYTLDIGADEDIFLEKFVTKKQIIKKG